MRKKKSSISQFGELPPIYRFILNPHIDARFSTCPNCEGKTLVRKVPLVIHVESDFPVTINKHCRYCPKCDILIVHQNELEHMLVLSFEKRSPKAIGTEYLVLGTLDISSWRAGKKAPILVENLLDHLHGFKERLEVEYIPPHWGPADEKRPVPRKK